MGNNFRIFFPPPVFEALNEFPHNFVVVRRAPDSSVYIGHVAFAFAGTDAAQRISLPAHNATRLCLRYSIHAGGAKRFIRFSAADAGGREQEVENKAL